MKIISFNLWNQQKNIHNVKHPLSYKIINTVKRDGWRGELYKKENKITLMNIVKRYTHNALKKTIDSIETFDHEQP